MMITLKNLNTEFKIKILLARDNLYKNILGITDIREWIPDMVNVAWYLVLDHNDPVGVIYFKQLGDNCLSYHGGIYKDYRGKNSYLYLQEALRLIKEQTNMALITTFKDSNKLAKRINERIGMTFKTRIKHGYKDSDMLIYGEAE